MSSHAGRKPKDPKMLVHVPRKAGADALALLQQTFGPHAPEAIRTLVASLASGIERYADVEGRRKRQSRFSPLLTEREMTFEAKSTSDAVRLKNYAHKWAAYYGCRVATRSHPSGQAITVYLVQAPA